MSHTYRCQGSPPLLQRPLHAAHHLTAISHWWRERRWLKGWRGWIRKREMSWLLGDTDVTAVSPKQQKAKSCDLMKGCVGGKRGGTASAGQDWFVTLFQFVLTSYFYAPPPFISSIHEMFLLSLSLFFGMLKFTPHCPPPLPTSIHLQPSSAKLPTKTLSFENHLLLFEKMAKIENIEMHFFFQIFIFDPIW